MNKPIKNVLAIICVLVLCTTVLCLACCAENQAPTIKITASADTITKGETVVLTVEVLNSVDKAVTLSVSDDTIVNLSSDNKLTVIADTFEDKTITITAKLTSDTTVTFTKSITVKANLASTVAITASADTIVKGEFIQLSADITNITDKTITWTASDTALVAIDADGKLTVIADSYSNKPVTVTATLANGTKAEKNIVVIANLTPSVTVTASADTIKEGESVKLTVIVVGNNTDYTWTVSNKNLVAVDADNNLTVVGDTTVDRIVSVTAALTADSSIFGSKNITVLAPVEDGKVGELTSEMLETLGNPSITVTGVLTDIYTNVQNDAQSSSHAYSMQVLMQDGRWSGVWGEANSDTAIADIYCKGTADNVKDSSGIVGHALEKIYINKNNQIEHKAVKNYMSIPSVWEAQHLWNHLSSLTINKFTYDAEKEVYKYNIGATNMDDLYLMTYLSYSLTPMLEDTLLTLYLKVEDGKISKLLGQTEVLYYSPDGEEGSADDYGALSYTTIELSFSNIGTTVVEDPTPYTASANADKLAAALQKMQNADNYTFFTKDTTTRAPQADEGDYSIEATEGKLYAQSTSAANRTGSTGSVGQRGLITADAALFAITGEYTQTMDGNSYHTSYSGYKKVDATYYEEFEYNTSLKALAGTKRVNGDFFNALPDFKFSANMFEFTGTSVSNNKTVYEFVLRDAAAIRDFAMAVCAYSYADDAEASTSVRFKICVDEDGNLVSTVFPYSLVGGTYVGYCTTTYSAIGTTVIPADTFEGYVPREYKDEWADYTTKYYSSTFSTTDSHEENTAVVLEAIYGDKVSDMPTPVALLNVFGDNISGPFYDWDEIGTDSNGDPIYRQNISVTISSTVFDENRQITNYDELMADLEVELGKYGFAKSVANTDVSGGETGHSNRYVTFVKGDITVVVENNFTKYFWVYFYITGEWTLN